MIPRIITTTQACKILGMGRATLIHIMDTDPDFPVLQEAPGCSRYINAEKLDDWYENRRKKAKERNLK